MPRKHFSHYLYFTSKDRRGSLFLLIIIIIICLLPFAYPFIFKEDVVENYDYDEQLAELKSQKANPASKNYNNNNYRDDDPRPYDHPTYSKYSKAKKGTLFYFDPNTISTEDWKKLGLRDKTIATIDNYRSKGGKFREPADIRKIWGLFPDEAERLIPYVRITSAASQENYAKATGNDMAPRTYEKKVNASAVDINQSDTSAWIALPGIGSKLSQRIISFRNKLGGFYSVTQVAETFGLQDSVYQKIKPWLKLSGEVEKININDATIDQLKVHPYIRYQLANAIVQYRNQHGVYKSTDDVRKIMIMNDSLFSKVSPYLSVQ